MPLRRETDRLGRSENSRSAMTRGVCCVGRAPAAAVIVEAHVEPLVEAAFDAPAVSPGRLDVNRPMILDIASSVAGLKPAWSI
jgi:hypothetical protein